MKKKLFHCYLLIVVLFFTAVIGSCASIKRLDNQAIEKYDAVAFDKADKLKTLQYFVSRDIVLTFRNESKDIDITKSGQASSSTKVNRDIIQILSSTPGIASEVRADTALGPFCLGISFETENDNLLYFIKRADGRFYLDHKNSKVVN